MRTPSINQVFNMYSFHFRFYVYEPCLSEKTFRKTRLSAICFNFIRFFYNEPVFLKYVIHVVLSVKTCPKVHLIHDMCILCTSFLMYKLFLSSLSFFLSLSLVTHVIKTKINHFIQAECCCIIISTILTIVDTAGVGHALSLR